ncbi:hypothetical protein QBC32DRAFT_271082 [Pseudoneurospora amorphoporcata]|uniref:DUF6594 domain-containing protein n=1 Tax=Pseudoneurospora amorphoporcata TaxID=241081 RepID=A0AAN6NK30_9PEZI|nr:hypothetical protein QBC32DRAFT_271082 [Pseudoneurospora amorphoporcata]
MWDQIYEQNIVKLISPQRPGVLGRLDKLTGLLSGRQARLTSDDLGYRVHFSDLQRMQIRYLHTKLANLAVSAHFHEDEWKPGGKAEEIGRVLKEYIQAVRDHEYMAKYANASDDPFIATSQRIYDKTFLESAIAHDGERRRDVKLPQDFLPSHVLKSEQGREQNVDSLLVQYATPTGPWERDNTNKRAAALTSTRTKAWKRAYWTRIGAAVIGGAFLIAPMWILALQRNLFVNLGVATACIAAFGASMSLYLETVDNVFAATLAYAAVIMVFVAIVIQETAPSVA